MTNDTDTPVPTHTTPGEKTILRDKSVEYALRVATFQYVNTVDVESVLANAAAIYEYIDSGATPKTTATTE